MNRYFTTIILLCMFCLSVTAQKVKKVEAEYTYYAPENVTPEQARLTALERAKIQALADEFGTIVSQYNTTRMENTNGQTELDFTSIGGSEVKGEWIETIGEPKFDITFEGNMLVVKVRVKGKAREIVSAQIDYIAKVLRNGTTDQFENSSFNSGDGLYLSFQSPVKGFLAVYLVDADHRASCLLPYQSDETGIYSVMPNRRYVFFNMKEAPLEERDMVDEYYMTCSGSTEHNQIYVIFSPNSFVKAVDEFTKAGLPRQLSYEDFNRWLVKQRKHDHQMTVRMFPIVINK